MTFLHAMSWLYLTFGRGRPRWEVVELAGGTTTEGECYVMLRMRLRE